MIRAMELRNLSKHSQKAYLNAVNGISRHNPDFKHRARRMIGRYVKVDELVDKIIEGLQKAGLDDLK